MLFPMPQRPHGYRAACLVAAALGWSSAGGCGSHDAPTLNASEEKGAADELDAMLSEGPSGGLPDPSLEPAAAKSATQAADTRPVPSVQLESMRHLEPRRESVGVPSASLESEEERFRRELSTEVSDKQETD